jgi:hypothetical protein
MTFAKWVFRISGIYGIAVLVPFYFLEDRICVQFPPAITHPEYFYGFLGVALAWQVAFLIISFNPVKYRLFMVPGMMEKFLYAGGVFWLYLGGRLSPQMLPSSIVDFIWVVLFWIAFWKTRAHHVHSL